MATESQKFLKPPQLTGPIAVGGGLYYDSRPNPREFFRNAQEWQLMPILASEALFHENKKIQLQNAILVTSDSKSSMAPFYTNLAFDCKTETLSSLYSHALLILIKSSKSKHQVVHEQKFKDLLSSTCQASVERSMLESEVQWFNTHWGNILLLEIFVFT